MFHHEVPAPGGMKGLEELIGRVSATPLDRSRPLWEMHVCQPFDDGRVAVVTKMHHALADGVAANALLGNLVDAPGDDVRPARERPRVDLELEPTPTRLDAGADGPARRDHADRQPAGPRWSARCGPSSRWSPAGASPT